MSDNNGGMTEDEARRFHGFFMVGTLTFVGTAIAAHIAAWMWRPWL